MSVLLEKLNYGLRWNALESTSYQTLLLIHNIYLFSLIPYYLYGIIGSIFSTIYLTISITNLGFDVTLPAYFSYAISCKQTFKKIIFFHYLPEILLLSLLFICSILLPNTHKVFSTFQIDAILAVIIALIIISEAFKKTLRTISHLCFLNKSSMVFELSSIGVYLVIVWSCIASGKPITLMLIFLPMLVSSWLATALYGYTIYGLYQTFPKEICTTPTIKHRPIIFNRLCNYLTHISSATFSTNFLVPLFALTYDFETAAFFKIASTVMHAMTSCYRSMFGSTSEALFSYAKNSDIEEKKNIFYSINNKSNIFLVITFFSCVFFLGIWGFWKFQRAHVTMLFLLAIMILQFLEHALLIHEKFFIAEEKSWYVSLCVFTFFLVSLFLIFSFSQAPLIITLLSLIAVRFITLITMKQMTWAYYRN